MNASERLSAGLKALPDKHSRFASTQAAWRFYGNESVSLQVLQAPLTAAAHEGIAQHCHDYALCVHDWSHLNDQHINKSDTYAITHEHDVGYDLQSSLIVSDQTGQPLAPVALRLVSAEGSYATYNAAKPSLPVKDHLDEVSDSLEHLESQGFGKPLVPIMDQEGDSVGHIRRWDAAGSHWLVWVKDNPKVEWKGKALACKTLAQGLEFHRTREVTYHGKRHWQWVAETDVRLTRPAKPSQKKGKKPSVPGIPVEARLVVSRVVTVWAIAADKSAEAAELRAFLVKLSGRQMRHKVEFTNPALLAGLWVFLSMLEIMEAYSQEELDSLKQTAQQFLGKVV